jgi:hypothetical protein
VSATDLGATACLDAAFAREAGWESGPIMAAGEKGPAARRRPKSGREAYCLYVERPVEGGNEADGPLSAAA